MEDFDARVAEPFSPVEFDFVVIPILWCAEEAIGLCTIREFTHVRPKVSEYVFPSPEILV